MITTNIRSRFSELHDALRNANVEVSHSPIDLREDSDEEYSSFEVRPKDGRMTIWKDQCQVVHTPPGGKFRGSCFPYSKPDWAKEAVKFYISCSQ